MAAQRITKRGVDSLSPADRREEIVRLHDSLSITSFIANRIMAILGAFVSR